MVFFDFLSGRRKRITEKDIEELKNSLEQVYREKADVLLPQVPELMKFKGVEEGAKQDITRRIGYRNKWIKLVSEIIIKAYEKAEIVNLDESVNVESSDDSIKLWNDYHDKRLKKMQGAVLDAGSFVKGTQIESSDVGICFFLQMNNHEIQTLWDYVKDDLNKRMGELGIPGFNVLDRGKLLFSFNDGGTEINIFFRRAGKRNEYYKNIRFFLKKSDIFKTSFKDVKSFTKLLNEKSGFNVPTILLEELLINEETILSMLEALFSSSFDKVKKFFKKTDDTEQVWNFYRIMYFAFHHYIQEEQ